MRTDEKGFNRLSQVFVGWGADEVPQSAALFRPPSPKPIVQLSLQWAFQHHLLHETDIGFRLIGLPYVTSWWQVVQSTSVLRFLAAIMRDPCWLFPTVIGFEVFQCSNVMHLNALGVSCRATVFTGIGEQPLFQL